MNCKNIAKPISIDVDGKRTSLHNYLLNQIEKPLPQRPTHYVVTDVLNKDLSIKRVTIYFNVNDNWKNPERHIADEKARSIGDLIGDNLAFIDRDPNSLAYTFYVMDIQTGDLVHRGFTYDFCNYDNY